MIRSLLLPLATLVLIAAPAAAQKKKAALTDWSRTVTLGPNGAYIVGNPKAPTKLVELFSYTCPHCSAFQAEGGPGLKAQWIKRGLVSLEYHNYVRDLFDLTAATLARCGGPTRFVANHEALFANHDPWMTKAQAYAANKGSVPEGDRVALLIDVADKTGLFGLLAAKGLPVAAQRKCMADAAATDIVIKLTESGEKIPGFDGTPFFVMNGKSLDEVHSWSTLQPLLPALPR